MRHDVLVRQDDAFRGLGEAERADDAALEDLAVPLFVHVQARLGVRGEDAFAEPGAQGVRRLLVAGGRAGGLRQDQPDDVVRVGGLQVQEAVWAHDHVVRG